MTFNWKRRRGARPLPTGGRGRKDCPIKGVIRKVAPHPALRGHLPPQGKAWGRVGRWVGGYRKGYRRGKYLLAQCVEKLYTDIIIMYGWNEP